MWPWNVAKLGSGGLGSKVECEGKGGTAPGLETERLGGGWLWVGTWESLGGGGKRGQRADCGAMERKSFVVLSSLGDEWDLQPGDIEQAVDYQHGPGSKL